MQKVILDTNIVVSALIQKSYPHLIVFDEALNEHVQLCLSEELLDDNKLLELADESNADFLITGNSVDFMMTHYKSTRVVSPRDFWFTRFVQL